MREIRFWAGVSVFILQLACAFGFLLWCLYSGLTRNDDKAGALVFTSVLFLPAFTAFSVHFYNWLKEHT